MKPMLKYRGGKSKEIKEIIKYVPEFTGRYIEPFFGGGALFFYLEPEKAIINDINKPLMDFYINVRENYKIVKDELNVIEKQYKENRNKFEMLKNLNPNDRVEDNNEDLYYKMRSLFNLEDYTTLNWATVYYFINKTAYSGMIRYNKEGKFNVPYGRYKNFNTDLISIEHSNLLKKSIIMNTDYSKVFELSDKDDFIFLDPPYDCVFNDYGNLESENGFTEEMHRKLADDFKKLNAKAMMVIGKTELTEELYGEYIVHEYDKSYAVNIRNRFKSESKHILVCNYDIKGE